MKKIIVLFMIAVMTLMPISGVANLVNDDIKIINKSVENGINVNLTHTILAEYFSTTTCPNCPSTSSQLYSIYHSSEYDFYYVTFVCNKIEELPALAQIHLYSRLNELGVLYVPDVFFDGGYKEVEGRQQGELPYKNAIEFSGTRDVPKVNIDLNVDWREGNTIEITGQIQTNDSEFKGKVRIFITEIESHWKDQQGNNFHYAVLDIPVTKSLSALQITDSTQQNYQAQTYDSTYTITKRWSGDITKDNCMVLMSVFDRDTTYAVQTAAAKPVSTSYNELSYDHTDRTVFKGKTTLSESVWFDWLSQRFPYMFSLLRQYIGY